MVEARDETRAIAQQALHYAGERLGAASEELLRRPREQALAVARVRAGASVEDAVLAVVFQSAREDRALAGEFLAGILGDTMRVAHSALSRGMRHLMDTGDLAHSVLGDLWSDLDSVEFRTRGQFVTFLLRKLRWKNARNVRAEGGTLKRGGAEPLDHEAADARERGAEPSPLSAAGRDDDLRRLVLLMRHLEPREQEMLRLYLGGASRKAIAAELGLPLAGVHRAMRRLTERLREEF